MTKSINFLVLSYCPMLDKLITVSRHRVLSRAKKSARKAKRRYGHSAIQEWTADDHEFINRYYA